jgi:hypothetical protein
VGVAPESRHSEVSAVDVEPILGRPPGLLSDWRVGKVCQVCGAIATVTCFEEWAASHAQGGEFWGFRRGHEPCSVEPPGAIASRPYRYCEICTQRTPAEPARRCGLSWWCEKCERRVRRSGHDTGALLAALARERFAGHEAQPDRAAGARADDAAWLSGERAAPPEGWLPPGLSACEACGEIRGRAWVPGTGGAVYLAESTCICGGIPCRRCGRGRVRRPISDHYDPRDGHFWHTPYFGHLAGCAECAGER